MNGTNRNRNATVAADWSDWLNQHEWDYFCTFTAKYHLTLASARRAMDIALDRVCRGEKAMAFWCAEEFNQRSGYHLHALIRSDYRAKEIWQWWFDRYGRARILLFDPKLGGSHYVAKYVCKKVVDYDIYTAQSTAQTSLIGANHVRKV